jgi:hypothetical protein
MTSGGFRHNDTIWCNRPLRVACASTTTTAGSWKWCYGACRRRCRHRLTILNIRCFYGRPGVREVGYDNERGKGDHRHFRGFETEYAFTTVEQLMEDFWSDVRALRGRE